MTFDPRNILVIDTGHLAEVVLSLPALQAIRERFPAARITVAVGKAGASVVDLSGHADATVVVDRHALRKGWKPLSIFRVGRIVRDVRRAQFDFVIDFDSLTETNLLGFLSGARHRLYARRRVSPLDFLSNFHPKPPTEDGSAKKHGVDRFLDVITPLGIKDAPRVPRLRTRADADASVEQMLKKERASAGAPLVGLFPGASQMDERWPLERFAELADYLVRNDSVRVVLFAGPKERGMVKEMRARFPRSTIIFDRLTIPQMASAFARLSVLVSDNPGPAQIAAAVGTSVVALAAPSVTESFTPIEEGRQRVVRPHRMSLSRPNPALRAIAPAREGNNAARETGAPPSGTFTVSNSPSAVQLGRDIDRQIDESEFARARWGVFVMSLKDGRVLYARNADRTIAPASNMKVYTTSVALDLLGADYRWRTSVYSESEPDKSGTISGDLTLYGRGAPDLSSGAERDEKSSLDELADKLYQRGVRHVRGDVVGDESYFRGDPLGDGWLWDDVQWYFGAEVSALTINDNAVSVSVIPSNKSGEAAEVKLKPETSYVQIKNETSIAEKGAPASLGVTRGLSDNLVRVWGDFPSGGRGLTARLS
ncbi:MAG: D-alanyl-D-alanine carboxypeptidase/D-alanyl-D-alanine-endopeptidase, partial [Acidobacteriota bacterium]|nr:D-alanyl-D-alanine carboxypeptidase/D-alanyl-D-alanine-endopeptidase [Acidobacteriota bacterium]